ncbi:MAG: tripartite tricarboxylate transporter substrate-binding protein [Haloferacaceae archaeon]
MGSDSSPHGSSANRRTFLKVTGGAAAASFLAGCSGGGSGGDGGSGSGESGSDGGSGESGSGGKTGGSNYPNQPVTMVIPYSTGGGYNYYSRLVAKYINQEDYLPVKAQPQNVTGGGGIIGHNRLYNADPDGYTAGIVNPDSMAKAQVTKDEARFDLTKLTFFPRIAGRTPCIAVGDHVDVGSGSELISKMASGELKIGHSGITSSGAMIPIALGLGSGEYNEDTILENDVQFDGKSQWLTSIKREEVDVMSGSYSSVYPFVESGDLDMTLVMTKKDKPPEETPDADTFADVDVDAGQVLGLAGGTYHRFFAAPPELPSERATVLRDAFSKAIKNEELQKEAADNDRPVSFMSSEEVKTGVEDTVATWKDNQDLLEKLTNA